MVVDRREAGHEEIRWYLDGRQFYSVSESRIGQAAWTAAVDHGFSILLNVAVGGAFPDAQCGCTTPDSQTSLQGTMVVQYVKVYTTCTARAASAQAFLAAEGGPACGP